VITALFIVGLWIFANVLVLAIALIRAKEDSRSGRKDTGEQLGRPEDKAGNEK
jgi:hypothetical protein